VTDDPFLSLEQWCRTADLPLTDHHRAQFQLYLALLLEWNARFNLTSVTEPSAVVLRHFVDSLLPITAWPAVPQRLLDIGSGAGFPALPLKIMLPQIDLTLLESIGKKATFLQHTVDSLQLEQVRVLNVRVEDLARLPAERAAYDTVTARAVAELRVLAEYAAPLLTIGGHLLALKGPDPHEEVAAAAPALHQLGLELVAVRPLSVAALPPRSLVVVRKLRATPTRFPRPAGTARSRPL
jgi:16S rRNA (guanine527-N7)-methyltransferase